MSGGVRNLRAMFENKDQSTSPPDRGRSPAGSIGGASSGTSPRPLSKVRTSFVAVERSGQMGNQIGLKREPSGEPSVARRRPSFSIDEEDDSKATAERKQSIAAEFDARKNSSVIEETIPENAIETLSIEVERKLDLASGNERGRGAVKPGITKLEEKKPLTTNALSNINGATKSAGAARVEKVPIAKSSPKPGPISTTRTSAVPKISPKKLAPSVPKTPTTPKSQATKSPERKAEKASRTPVSSAQTSKPASRPATTAAHGSAPKTRIQASPPQTGFHKPRPRSPTRPVKLPASLTAHTASSGSKTASGAPAVSTGRRSLSRASGVSQTAGVSQAPATTRSPSRASSTAAKSTLNRKSSMLGNRPSLGPPPSQLKKQPSRQSLPHQAPPADESFLARMMRPTTSSASKTADKSTTPPKRVQSVKKPGGRGDPPKFEVPKQEKSEGRVGAVAQKAREVVKKVARQERPAVKEKGGELETSGPDEKLQGAVVTASQERPEIDTRTPVESLAMGEALTIANRSYKATEDAKDLEARVANAAEKDDETSSLASLKREELDLENSMTESKVPSESTHVEEDVHTQEPDKAHEVTMPEPELVQEEEVKVIGESILSPVVEESSPSKDEFEVLPAKDRPAAPELTSVKDDTPSKLENPVAEPVLSPSSVDSTEVEDPEDAKAREEIAKLNAEVIKSSEAAPTDVVGRVEPA